MADVRAFRGFRYDLGQVGELSAVVAPPYDVIDPALQEKLYAASPYNAVRLELTKDSEGDKYTAAARTLNAWLAGDVLKQDTSRSLYVYEQEFRVDGKTHTRRGFLARVRLEPFGTGRIFPHEQTLAGPKADRLKLYQATGFNISPVFGLFPDSEGEVFAALEPQLKKSPPLVAKDHLGVVNRLWVITDTATISYVVGLMGPRPVYIADGHHRYETGLKYLDEQKAAGTVLDDEAAPNFCLMMLVGMSDPGLIIQPTHRLISGIPAITTGQLQDALLDEFDVVETSSNALECWEIAQLHADADPAPVLAFGTVTDNKWFVARFREPEVMDTLAAEHSATWRSLPVSVLHTLVLEKIFAEKVPGTPTCQYVHTMKEVTDSMAAKACRVAVLVPPVGMDEVEAIAGNRETMPPKSTYFYPKILTGMVLNSLKKD